MADEEHLQILKQDVKAWREEHLDLRIDLSGADLYEANLIYANLDRATLTDAYLWETQRAGWSIQGIICAAAYWDKDGQERTPYSTGKPGKPGEFERLYEQTPRSPRRNSYQ